MEIIGLFTPTTPRRCATPTGCDVTAFPRILADCQHGFRGRRSCETQLVQFYHDWVSNLDRALNRDQRQTDGIIMDFAKAVDLVPHRRLCTNKSIMG